METYVLMFQLMRDGPVLIMPVTNCEVGVTWIHDARNWAERSGIDPVTGPMYACFPTDSAFAQQRVRQ